MCMCVYIYIYMYVCNYIEKMRAKLMCNLSADILDIVSQASHHLFSDVKICLIP